MVKTETASETPDNKAKRRRTHFAMVDPGFLHISLFRPLSKTERLTGRLHATEFEFQFGGRRLKVVTPYKLGADDLLVLLTICALGGLERKKQNTSSPANRIAIVDGLESEGEVVECDHLRIRTRISEIIREAGLIDTGGAHKRASSCLERLAAVTYADLGSVSNNTNSVRMGGKQRLLWWETKPNTGELIVILNARFTNAILGGQFSRIDLNDARKLGESSLILLTRLSSYIRENTTWSVSEDRLAEWLYGDLTSSIEKTQRNERRKKVRKSLKGLEQQTRWICRSGPKEGHFSIWRPSHNHSS